MRLIFALAAALALTFAAPGPAAARDLTDAETTALVSTVDGYARALRASDLGRLVDTIPPKLLALMATTAGVDVDRFREQTKRQLANVMNTVRFEDVSIETSALSDPVETEEGLVYAFIPYAFVMATDAERNGVAGRLLALREGDAWYLLRVETGVQVQLLKDAYPSLKDVAFATDTVTPVE